MYLSEKAKFIIFAIIIAVMLAFLWPRSSNEPAKTKRQAGEEDLSSNHVLKRHRFMLTEDTTANKLRPSEQKHLDSTKIAPGQTTLIAKNDEQYLAILERLAALGITPKNTLDQLRAINVILDDATLAKLKNEFDEISAAQDTIVWIPEDSIEPWSGRLGPSFGSRLLDWLGINASKENRGGGVTVAVLDTAISKSVVNQNADIKQIDLFNYAQSDGEEGHGNAVASLLVANDNELTGLAPSIELLSIPVLDNNGEGSAFDLAMGIIAAVDAGANVISMSLGSYATSPLLKAAVDYAAAAGVVMVAASGNDGVKQVLYPAAYDNVIAVGAVDANGNIAGFSNTGSEISLAAPGVGINSAWTEGAGVVSFSGTSAAVPCVVGVVANILSDYGGSLSPAEAAEQVINYTIDNGAPNKDETYGQGVLDYSRAANADTPGIFDASAAGHFLDVENATETDVPLVVSAQNTGTETLPTMTLTAVVDGVSQSFTFVDVKPGEVVSSILSISVSQIETNGKVKISTTVSTPNDNRLGNETKTSIISISEE
ncbi:MAG: S8 family serine peptidase [Victivallales bacterium]|nr:S8 family serine peptidase [Victivallales bacterium]